MCMQPRSQAAQQPSSRTWTPAFRKLHSQLLRMLAFLPSRMLTKVDLNTPLP